MGFHENARFPETINYGSRGGPGFSTSIVEVDSGQEERIARWDGGKSRYNAAYGIKSRNALGELITFYRARRGSANGFRFKDWLDYATTANHRAGDGDDPVTATDFQLGLGDTVETQFQILKKYTDGSVTRTRNLTKPVSGTVLVALDGVVKAEGVDYTVDHTVGIITFTVAPGLNVIVTAGCEFDVPVRFGKELDFNLSLGIDDFSTGGIGDIPLVELLADGSLSDADEFFYGGSLDMGSLAGDSIIALSILSGRAITADSQNANTSLLLPNPAGFPGGGPYWYIKNQSAAFTLPIKDHNLVTIFTIPTEEAIEVVLESSTSTWFAL